MNHVSLIGRITRDPEVPPASRSAVAWPIGWRGSDCSEIPRCWSLTHPPVGPVRHDECLR